jgi:hypothetical protein
MFFSTDVMPVLSIARIDKTDLENPDTEWMLDPSQELSDAFKHLAALLPE